MPTQDERDESNKSGTNDAKDPEYGTREVTSPEHQSDSAFDESANAKTAQEHKRAGERHIQIARYLEASGADAKLVAKHRAQVEMHKRHAGADWDPRKEEETGGEGLPPGGAAKTLTGDSMATVQRWDRSSGTIVSHRSTPNGDGLTVRANLTRTGVFHYPQEDGTVRRELRLPEEVFDKDSLDSAAHATLTIDHPERVTPKNYKAVTVGHVAGRPTRDGRFISGELHVRDASAIDKVEKGHLQELSCGYECKLEPKSGTYGGEHYDAIQRNIRYNHVALLPPGHGRAGPEVRLHLDGKTSVPGGSPEGDSYVPPMPDAKTVEQQLAELKTTHDALVKEHEKLKTDSATPKADAVELERLRGEMTKLTADVQRLSGENTALKATQDSANKVRQDAEEIQRFDEAVERRTTLIADARRVLGRKFDHKGQSDVAIKRAILAKLTPKVNYDGKDAGFIEGAFNVAIESSRQVRDSFDDFAFIGAPQVNRDGGRKSAKDTADPDGDGDDDSGKAETDKAYDSMVERDKNAWKTPKKDRGGRAAPTH